MAGAILIGFDDTEVAGRALDRAIEEAKSSGDPLVVLAVMDMPFDPEGGPGFVRDTIKAVDAIEVSDADRQLIYEGNAKRMLRLKTKG